MALSVFLKAFLVIFLGVLAVINEKSITKLLQNCKSFSDKPKHSSPADDNWCFDDLKACRFMHILSNDESQNTKL